MNERQQNSVQKYGLSFRTYSSPAQALKRKEQNSVSRPCFSVSHSFLSTAKRHQLGSSAGELLQCLAVISVCHLSTFLPPSKSTINIQNVFHSKVPSAWPHARFAQTVCTVSCSRSRWYTRFWILVNQVEPFQTYLPYLVFFLMTSMMMHFWSFPKGFGHVILQL